MPSNQVRDTRLLVTMSCSIVICNNYNISVSMVMVREGFFLQGFVCTYRPGLIGDGPDNKEDSYLIGDCLPNKTFSSGQ